MSVRYENECCGCATESYPCLGSDCPNRNVPYYICDICGNDIEDEEMHEKGGKHYCKNCWESEEK